MITLKLTIKIENPVGVAELQKRLEKIVRLLPHYYEVFQDSGASLVIADQAVASKTITKLENPE